MQAPEDMQRFISEGARRARRDQMIAAAVSGLLHAQPNRAFEEALARAEFADLATSIGIDVKVFQDGNQWRALIGVNLMKGIAGFGSAIPAALSALAEAFTEKGASNDKP
jgi:UDP-N-acetyl-D-mannosaminuronic acid transferase (WecB/TagA/CpsF family)